jgi:hypothetical protein
MQISEKSPKEFQRNLWNSLWDTWEESSNDYILHACLASTRAL